MSSFEYVEQLMLVRQKTMICIIIFSASAEGKQENLNRPSQPTN